MTKEYIYGEVTVESVVIKDGVVMTTSTMQVEVNEVD